MRRVRAARAPAGGHCPVAVSSVPTLIPVLFNWPMTWRPVDPPLSRRATQFHHTLTHGAQFLGDTNGACIVRSDEAGQAGEAMGCEGPVERCPRRFTGEAATPERLIQ